MLDLELLRFTWWLLVGVLFAGFAITDGFDLGAAILMPFISRNDLERRIVLNAIGPFWEGNQVWILLAAGALFAAWPLVYAVAFSGAYFAVLLLLLTMGISRPVSFKYRSKLSNPLWRRSWDIGVFIGGLAPAFLFGVLVGNLLSGIPFYFDDDLRAHNSVTFFGLLNPFSLGCGLVSVSLLVMHGAAFLNLKCPEPLHSRTKQIAKWSALTFILLFSLMGYYTAYYLDGYRIISVVDHYGYSNPLHKSVDVLKGAWLTNYTLYPVLCFVPMITYISALLVVFFAWFSAFRLLFLASAITILGTVGTLGVSMFPFILPSSTNLGSSLLVWDASSSALTLLVMLVATIIFLPIILAYTTWVYYSLRGGVNQKTIMQDAEHTAY